MGQRSVPAPFLMKTYEMVDDGSTDEVISWGENGTTFVVWKTAEFAKDLLPNYFKHNNFSSFVRQLNTYGFHKIVPDKWEFANDNFKRGHKDLLTGIRRRKTTAPPSTPTTGKPSQSTSGEDAGSTSTSSPGSKRSGSSSLELADLSGENEKLRRDNEMLSLELCNAKKQCDDLMTFLTGYLKVGPERINQVIRNGACGTLHDGVVGNVDRHEHDDDDDDDDDDEKEVEECRKKEMEKEGLKLFGVWLEQGNKNKKRGRCCDIENDNGNYGLGFCGAQCGRKVMKTL